jgi:hypothetical protein
MENPCVYFDSHNSWQVVKAETFKLRRVDGFLDLKQ